MKKIFLSSLAVLTLLIGCTAGASKDDYKILPNTGLSLRTEDGERNFKAFIVIQNTKNVPIDNVDVAVYFYRNSDPERFLLHTFEHNFMRKEIKSFEAIVTDELEKAGFSKDDYVNSENDQDVKFEYRIVDEFGKRVYLLDELVE